MTYYGKSDRGGWVTFEKIEKAAEDPAPGSELDERGIDKQRIQDHKSCVKNKGE